LLTKVNSRAAIRAHRRVRSVLEGEYGSVHKGRSMDFDDLREYVDGDDIKDIDWKATARSLNPLVKRFVAMRQHSVLLLVDTGKSMAALADVESAKRDVAVMAAGIVAQLAARHGDLVSLVAGPADEATSHGIIHLPPGKSKAHLERILRAIHDNIDADGAPSNLDSLYAYVIRTIRRRMIVLVIADDIAITDRQLGLLRQLHAQHEVLYCMVADVPLSAAPSGDVRIQGSGGGVPAFFRADRALTEQLRSAGTQRAAATSKTLQRIGIPSVRLTTEDTVLTAVIELLERQRRARR